MVDETHRIDLAKVDPRIYLGILVFRWKLIAICFIYCLLGGVIYLEVVPRQYLTHAAVMIYRDPNTKIDSQSHLWEEGQTHIELLRSEAFQERVRSKLVAEWSEKVGGPENLSAPLSVRRLQSTGIGIEMSVQNRNPAYARAFLTQMVEEFRSERNAMKNYASQAAARVLEDELVRLNERINEAEDDVIEFQRMNEFEYVQQKGQLELGYLQELLSRHQQLSTERWMMEVQFPQLKAANAEVIRNTMDMTHITGAIRAPRERRIRARKPDGGGEGGEATTEEMIVEDGGVDEAGSGVSAKAQDRGWQELRLRLAKVESERAEASARLQPEHPQLKALNDEIRTLQRQLEFYRELELNQAKERYEALAIHMDALEEAQRRWKNSYLMASKKGSDLRHLQLVVTRLETMHGGLYSKLNDLKIEAEINAEHFSVIWPVRTEPRPVWPDPLKILLGALMAGVGGGLGLALVAHSFDNKVQSIHDVEAIVKVPFLGGIPYWIHDEPVGRVRPIVSEEHRSGAAEAYRALRTNILASLEKAGKRVVVFTSADSKEGKTLTVLNTSIMLAKAGKRVLLLDMDLRRGVLHKSLEVARSPGMTDVLHKTHTLRDVILATAYENLWFVPAGSTDANTSELLHRSDVEGLLREAMADYDYLLLDSAPVLRATDTVVLAGIPLCTVICVAHANRTPKPMIRYALDMLGDVHVLGMIINSIDMNRISSLYYTYQYPNYAYYSYSYAYGYDYYLYDEKGRKVSRHRHPAAWKSLPQAVAQWLRRTFLPME